MKHFVAILFCFWAAPLFAQFYLRGSIKTAQGAVLPFASIRLSSRPTVIFNSGSSGGFGIPLSKKNDTLTVSHDGYEVLVCLVSADVFQNLVMLPAQKTVANGNGLMSLTKSLANHKPAAAAAYGDDTYLSLAENTFVKAADVTETGLALTINSASYSNIRRFLNMKNTVPPDGVRIEEMLNYFNLNKIKNDTAAQLFGFATQLTTCPWKPADQLLFINIRAPKLNLSAITPAKFIFLIDVSGSMDKDNRLPLVQAAFKFLVRNLRAADTVGIVTYGGYVGIALPPTSGAEKEKITSIIDGLHADGDTPGSQAIQTAYDLAETIADSKSNNRVILATDGDFNIGQTTDKELEAIISSHKQKGIYLTCLGTGMGNAKDSRLERLAKAGNGNFAYIDNLQEAQKTMFTEFTKNRYAVADHASLHVNFNAEAVKSYRLIGYDNRKDALQDTALMQGGELGSGQAALAVFEVEPNSAASEPLVTVQLHYELMQSGAKQIKSFTADNRCISFDSAAADVRFATSVCMFGSLLKRSPFAADYSWDNVLGIAKSAYFSNDISEKEFIELIVKAKDIYTENSNDKRKRK